MQTLSLILAAICLVPQPRKLTELGGSAPKGTAVSCVTDATVPKEGYRLTVKPDGITVTSSDEAGKFYAGKTLEQLFDGKGYPCVEIEDAPRFPWRGVLIDEGRHFLGKVTVKRVLDQMAMHKLNVLHWHLTEDQGWRLEVPGLPELVKYGSSRPETPAYGAWCTRHEKGGVYEIAMDGQREAPSYYSEADVKEIVAYAAARQITVVPEIEVPGHAFALLAAYPELACCPENCAKRTPRCAWGIQSDVLCVGNPEAIRTYERIFDYVCSVFPSKVIHIGGDECPRVRWKTCPKCQAFMKAQGMKDEDGLQAWVTRHFADYLAKKGRRILGWDEILAGDVPASAMGQVWRTSAKGGAGTAFATPAEAAAKGHDLVMSPVTHCYHDYTQGLGDEDPYQYISRRTGRDISLQKAYEFDPLAGLPESSWAHVVGGQSNNWGEFTWTHFDLEWKMWPRACATAEVLWTYPDPARRDYADFRRRMLVHRKRLLAAYVNCAPFK